MKYSSYRLHNVFISQMEKFHFFAPEDPEAGVYPLYIMQSEIGCKPQMQLFLIYVAHK